MSEKIKYRAWDKENKKMQEVSSIKFDEKEVGYIYEMQIPEHNIEADECFLDFDEVELMQYTGLKDKNGKEIYVGDILKSESGAWLCEVDSPSFAGFDFKIIKAPAGCDWQIGDNFLLSELRINEARYEVIGNIYQNKDLLK